jgi:AcrR family transcriptional regulator
VSNEVNKRAYTSPARHARAEATRARIIDAATALFLAGGYARTSTAAIGKAARTSEASIFAIFGSKAELLVAVVAHHVGQHPDFPLRSQPVWQELAAEASPDAAIAEFARVTRRAHERSWRLLAVVTSAKEDDPTVSAAATAAARRRHADCQWFITQVIGIHPDAATRKSDAVWTLISVDNYRHLVIDCAWPPEDYEAWLAALIHATVT